jgi:hypothetical protein
MASKLSNDSGLIISAALNSSLRGSFHALRQRRRRQRNALVPSDSPDVTILNEPQEGGHRLVRVEELPRQRGACMLTGGQPCRGLLKS